MQAQVRKIQLKTEVQVLVLHPKNDSGKPHDHPVRAVQIQIQTQIQVHHHRLRRCKYNKAHASKLVTGIYIKLK